MSSIDMDVKTYLEKHNYSVVAQLQQDGCILSFPQRKMYPATPEWFAGYIITKTGVTTMAVGLTKTDISVHNKMPNYASRVFVMLSIIKQCRVCQIPSSLVTFAIGQQLCSEAEFFNGLHTHCKTKKSLKQEGLLYQLAIEALVTGINDSLEKTATDAGIEKGYIAIKKLFGEK